MRCFLKKDFPQKSVFSIKLLSTVPCSRDFPNGGMFIENCLHISIPLHACLSPPGPLTPPPFLYCFTRCSIFPSHDMDGHPTPNASGRSLRYASVLCYPLLRHYSHMSIPSQCTVQYFSSPISPLHSVSRVIFSVKISKVCRMK